MTNDNKPFALSYEVVTGDNVEVYADDVARLRIAVFAEWPYLYQGDLDYERWYQSHLASTKGALIVLARVGGQIVGASTGMPLDQEHDAFQQAMRIANENPSQWFYLAESVLLPAYRGRGVGHAFFDAREAHAQSLGYEKTCFCSVVRPDDHPLRDASVRLLDGFWHGRGYRAVEGAVAQFGWTDSGAKEETKKPLQMWAKG